MELLAVDRARAAVRDAATRDGSALGSTFGYLPEPQRELAAPAPPAGTIEIVTRASALDYSVFLLSHLLCEAPEDPRRQDLEELWSCRRGRARASTDPHAPRASARRSSCRKSRAIGLATTSAATT